MGRKKWIIFLLILIILALGAFYIYFINTFNTGTLKRLDIQEEPLDVVAPYTLTEQEAGNLFAALNTAVKLPDAELPETPSVFLMTLLNRWDISKSYSVYIVSADEVYLVESDSGITLQITDPKFFTDFAGFDSLYQSRYTPSLLMTLNEASVPFNFDINAWAFQRYSGTWVDLEPLSEEQDGTVEVLNAEDSLKLSSDKMPTAAYLTDSDTYHNTVIYEGPVNTSLLPLPETDGEFSYNLRLVWQEDDQGYRGEAQIAFEVSADYPEIYAIDSTSVKQGDLIRLTLSHANATDDISVEQDLSNSFAWFKSGDGYVGYIPTNYNTDPGTYAIKLTNTRTGTVTDYSVEVLPRTFKIQYLTVDPNVEASTRSDEAYAEYYEYFGPSRDVSADTPLYEGDFILPVSGRLSTEFGETRYVNDEPTSYHHNGIDIAAPAGTEVHATNSGKVVLSMLLQLTGNTIVIDHGEGIFSVYLHMNTRNFEAGDTVEKDDVIGTVGSTGFSTGPHLHFSMYYYTTALEPGYFLYGQAITKENYETLFNR